LAQRIAGVPIIQSYANGRAFGRVDLIVDRASGKVIASHLEPPHDICPGKDPTTCNAKDYENEPVQPDRAVADLLAPSFAKAREKGHEKLGTQVARDMPFSRKQETALGNLLTDLMRTARTGTNPLPRAGVDVAMINGGAMRAGLPAGPLTYAHLYETFPFDNAFAYVRLPARQFRRALARSLANSSSQVSLSGLRVIASCRAGTLDVELERPDGSNIADQQVLGIATTDFLATGGDGFFQGTRASFEIGPPLREGLADALRARGGTIDPEDPALFDLAHPRIVIPSQVPVECRGRHIKAPDQAHVHHNEPQPGHG
jgi:5'-nucleotidase